MGLKERRQNGNKRNNKSKGRPKDLSQHSSTNEGDQPGRKEKIQRRYTIMKLYMYVLKDELSEYGMPQCFQTDQIAKRYMQRISKETAMIRNAAEDFSLWKIGEYDSGTGLVDRYEPFNVELIAKAKDYIKEE